jgi:hypothetical protein
VVSQLYSINLLPRDALTASVARECADISMIRTLDVVGVLVERGLLARVDIGWYPTDHKSVAHMFRLHSRKAKREFTINVHERKLAGYQPNILFFKRLFVLVV